MSKAQIYVANIAKAKLIWNKNKETYTIKIAFNVTEKTEKGAWKFPVKCDFVSGDINYETLEADKQRVIETAKQQLRTELIEFV